MTRVVHILLVVAALFGTSQASLSYHYFVGSIEATSPDGNVQPRFCPLVTVENNADVGHLEAFEAFLPRHFESEELEARTNRFKCLDDHLLFIGESAGTEVQFSLTRRDGPDEHHHSSVECTTKVPANTDVYSASVKLTYVTHVGLMEDYPEVIRCEVSVRSEKAEVHHDSVEGRGSAHLTIYLDYLGDNADEISIMSLLYNEISKGTLRSLLLLVAVSACCWVPLLGCPLSRPKPNFKDF